MEKNKFKGQVGSLQGVIAVLIIVAALIAAGFLVLERFSQEDQFFNAKSVTNETSAFANQTGYTVARENGGQTQDFVLTAAWNATNATGGNAGYKTSIPLANLSLNSVTGLLTNATSGQGYTNISVSYTYNEGTEGWTGLNDTVDALRTVPDLLGLVVLIVIVGIVLAVIFNVIPEAGVSGA